MSILSLGSGREDVLEKVGSCLGKATCPYLVLSPAQPLL